METLLGGLAGGDLSWIFVGYPAGIDAVHVDPVSAYNPPADVRVIMFSAALAMFDADAASS